MLQEVAAAHSARRLKVVIADSVFRRPVQVRDYLQREGLLEGKEEAAIASVYGLLSNTGSHPYMAAADQARLLRQLALTLAQFIMLRLRGALSEPTPQ